MSKAVVLLSGGMDSTTALALTIRNSDPFGSNGAKHVIAVSFDYGQRHDKELIAAENISRYYEVEHTIMGLRGAAEAFQGSALTGEGEIPEGHYADETMKKTVVPNRNMIMLSLAVGFAISQGAKRVVYAAHAGDHAIYPDCRPEFYVALNSAVQLGNYNPPEVQAPFVTLGKHDIARIGFDLKVPYDLTWSCYKGGELHCGKCGTCVERREAFELAEVQDPTVYEDDPASILA